MIGKSDWNAPNRLNIISANYLINNFSSDAATQITTDNYILKKLSFSSEAIE